MTPPSVATRFLGHGLVQVGSVLGFLWGLYAGFSQGAGPIPALACLILAHFAYRSGEKVRTYKQWKAEWDSLAPRRFRL